MMRTVIFLFFICMGGISFAQKTVIELKPIVRDDDSGKSLSGATIEVYKNGSLFASESSSSNGKVPSLQLPVCEGCFYTIKIKKGGYVTKTAVVDGHSDYPEELPPGTVVQKFEVTIFETVEGIDFSFLDREPMVEFAIDSYGMINYDQQKIKIMKKKIDDLKKKMEKKKEEIAEKEAEEIKREADFNAYVKAGDDAVGKRDYEKGIGQYELALGLKPDHQPTKDKIANAKMKLEEMRSNELAEKEYSDKMIAAKNAYSKEELKKALTLFKEASTIKPEEKLPKDKIAEIEKKIADQKKNEAEFNKLVVDGDGAMGTENFDEAILKYEAALKLRKDEPVQVKLNDAKKKKIEKEGAEAAAKENQKKYDDLMAKAQGEADAKKYEDAKRHYNEALTVKPDESLPKEKIAAIDKLLKEQADEQAAKDKLEADYTKLMADGKEKINQRTWEDAKSKYQEALTLKPNDSEALKQLDFIKKEIENQVNEEKRNAEYEALMTQGQTLLDQKKYEEAKSKYNEAAGIKTQEQAPKDKIKEIDLLLANAEQAAELEAKYTALMSEGDAAKDQKDYATAIDKYNKALEAKPNDPIAKTKLAAAEKLLEEDNKLVADQKKYDDLMAKAQNEFDLQKYQEAKMHFNEALIVKPTENLPKEKIDAIDKILADNAANDKLEADYTKLMAEGKEKFNQRTWEDAKSKYQEALALKPSDSEALNQIDLINKEIENQAGEEKINAEYDALMSQGQTLFDQKKYSEAKSKYSQASGIKTQEQAPKDKIIEIDLLLADAEKAEELEAKYTALMSEGNAAKDRKDYATALDRYRKALDAKPNDAVAKTKLAAVEKLIEEENQLTADQKKYDDFVAEAERSFTAKNYDQAKLNYNKALEIKDNIDIHNKIAEIDELIAKNQSEAETQAKYDAAINEADQLYQANNHVAALNKYKAALSIKEEDYPKGKISELTEKIAKQDAADTKDKEFSDLVADGNIAYDAENYTKALDKFKEAIKVKPDPTISQRIGELNVKLAELSQNADKKAQYDKQITAADAAFKDKNWNGAIDLYREAKNTLSSETYPDEQITEIKKRMKAESQAETEKSYQKIITKADGLFDTDKLDDATIYYKRAAGLKPSDAYPNEQLEKIKAIKKERANASADEKRVNDQYDAFIGDGEKAFNAKNWQLALDKFKEALKLKPSESYPKNRIAEIESNMDAADVKRQKEEEYTAALVKADQLFNRQDYLDAIAAYNDALNIKPTEQYPKDKIISAENFLKLESKDEAEAAYQKILTVAQKSLDEKNYEKAMGLYQRAKGMKPSDPIPQQRIDEINQILLKNGEADKLEDKYKDALREADYQFEKGNWVKAKISYTEAYTIFNREYPENKIKECDAAMQNDSVDEVQKNYDKLIKKADEYFAKKEYDKAKSRYKRALGFKPSDQHPKDQLAAIEKIMNPNQSAQTSTNLPNYGDPNRSTNAIDVDAMLADAEEQRKFISAEKARQQRIDAANAEKLKDNDQTDYNYNVREDVIAIEEDISSAAEAADIARDGDAKLVEEMQVNLSDAQSERVVTNDNDVEHQYQIVNNINLDLEQRDDAADLPREEYLANVEEIRSEIILENSLENNDQTNSTFEQVDYVEDFKENRIEGDPNMDAARKNTEVHIEDYNIQLINQSNDNSWSQEDMVMEVKENTEILMDEQYTSRINSDIPRIEGVARIEDEVLTRIGVEVVQSDNQYDVTVDQKKYTERVIDEIEIENIGNDIPRQNMENFAEDQRIENSETVEDFAVDQNNEMHKTDGLLEELEIKIVENKVEDDKNREGYEEVVEIIKEDKDKYLKNKDAENENDSHQTIDYLEDRTDDRTDIDKEADDSANDLIDNTNDMVDDMKEKNGELDEKSRVDLEKAEDFVESLKDIDVNKIDEEMKNSLGSQFPNGVTEEIYTINDENGLMTSYIVRRIVVRNSAGNVYEKVQTKFGTTSYTCNGHGITEYEWQDQTEAADLTRN